MKTPSIAEPVTELRTIKIVDNGEPLVDFLQYCPELMLDQPRMNYKRETLVRKSVAEMLCKAAKSLPKGYRLGMIEGWRGPHIQRRMYMMTWNMMKEKNPEWSETKLKRVVNQFTAPPNKVVPPPHSTGGAVDVNLLNEDGQRLDHSSPYHPHDPKGFFFDAPGLSDVARRNRDILAEAMLAGGLTNYPSEYWHWSYGDQGWAYRGGRPHALFGPIEPPNWQPAPEDVSEEPLYLLPLGNPPLER